LVETAAFSPDGTRIVTASQDTTARIWDVAGTSAVKFGVHALLTSAVQFGVGKRTPQEASDILMQDAPKDMFASLCEIPNKDGLKVDLDNVAKATALLRAPKHPNCYRSLQRSGPEPEETDESSTEIGSDETDGDGVSAGHTETPAPRADNAASRSKRPFPIIAVLMTIILLLCGLAAGATMWGPEVGFTLLRDLLSGR
jgi:hypothetical protein